MSFLPGLGGLGGVAGIVAAPFTGGLSLLGTAVAAGNSALSIDAKHSAQKAANQTAATSLSASNNTTKWIAGGIALIAAVIVFWKYGKRF
jgi:hypothetical protein